MIKEKLNKPYIMTRGVQLFYFTDNFSLFKDFANKLGGLLHCATGLL